MDELVVDLRALYPPLRVILQELFEVRRDDGVRQHLLDEDVVVLDPRVEASQLPHDHLRVLAQIARLDEAQKALEEIFRQVLGVPLQQCFTVIEPLMEEAYLPLLIILIGVLSFH